MEGENQKQVGAEEGTAARKKIRTMQKDIAQKTGPLTLGDDEADEKI